MTNYPDAPNESTHLLSGEGEETVYPRTPEQNPRPTPLPKAQLGALIAVRIVDPIAYQQIFPYVNQLLVDLKVAKPERVGFYSGLVESAYSLAQVFSVYQWGKISDIVGRRPVVFTGLLGIAVTTIMFGLSTSFAGIIVSRFLGGLVAGNVAVIHSILAEITDDTNQDLAVPIYSLAWPAGTVVGPLIGGTLANAATRYPQYFSWSVFVEYPYLPPCVVSAVCALMGTGLGFMFIQETHPTKRKAAPSTRVSPPRASNMNEEDRAESPGVVALLSIPAVRALTISGFALSFLSLAFDVVFTLFCYTPIDAGGLGFEPAAIGDAFAFAGMLAVLLRFFAMPYILQRFDYARTYNTCMYIWPIAFGFLPFLNVLVRAHPLRSSGSTVSTSPVEPTSTLVWIGLLTLLGLSKIGAIPHSLSMLLVKRHAPSPSALGRSNGLVQFAMCAGRAVGPIVVSTLFTEVNGMEWARRYGVGWIWAAVMVVGAVGGASVTRGIRSDPGPLP